MRKNYLLGTIACALFLFGCSSIYTVKNFTSKQKLYQDFNSSARDKKINVIFLNDSSITLENGAVIKNDTLFAIIYQQKKIFGRIAVSKIKNINYTGRNYKSAILLLKNGKQLKTSGMNIINDTLNCLILENIPKLNKVAMLDKLKTALYKNNLLGVPEGFVAGATVGFIAGYWISEMIKNHNSEASDAGYAISSGTIIGAITGSIIGWLNGYKYIYQFNP